MMAHVRTVKQGVRLGAISVLTLAWVTIFIPISFAQMANPDAPPSTQPQEREYCIMDTEGVCLTTPTPTAGGGGVRPVGPLGPLGPSGQSGHSGTTPVTPDPYGGTNEGTSGPSVNLNCVAGVACTGLGGRSGVWFVGRGNPCCGEGGGCCQVDPRGVPIACLAGPFTCSGGAESSPRPTATPNLSLPLCAEGVTCTSVTPPNPSGKWTKICGPGNLDCFSCCMSSTRPFFAGGGSLPPVMSCHSGPFQQCRAEPTPPPPVSSASNCGIGLACQSVGSGGVGKMTLDRGCCSTETGCMAPPYVCPPTIGVTPPSPPSSPYLDPLQPAQCQKGFTKLGGRCVIDPVFHTCARSANGSVMSSASGADFDTFLNPKLKCCMGEYDGTFIGGAHYKFDCIENVKSYPDFDQLWDKSDLDVNGGAPYAVTLSGFASKPVTGFYALESGNLRRCGEFSEFAANGPIQPYRVDGPQTVVQQNKVGEGVKVPVGSPIPIPTGAGFSSIRSKVLGQGKRIPETVQEMRRCPVLVRAAMLINCKPSSSSNPNTYVDNTASTDKVRCISGASVQFQIQLRQVYEITGQATLKTVDTLVNSGAQGTLSIEQILKTRVDQ